LRTVVCIGGGFPNLLFVQPTQGANLISNVPHNIVDSARTIAVTIRYALDNGFGTVEPSRAAEDAWVDLLLSGPGSMIDRGRGRRIRRRPGDDAARRGLPGRPGQ